MRTQIQNPKILLLNNSLGYVQEDDGYVDIDSENKQQETFMKIIENKSQSFSGSRRSKTANRSHRSLLKSVSK